MSTKFGGGGVRRILSWRYSRLLRYSCVPDVSGTRLRGRPFLGRSRNSSFVDRTEIPIVPPADMAFSNLGAMPSGCHTDTPGDRTNEAA